MSHFTVLVVGPDVALQLAPFHEFECTGSNDQYVQDVDITSEMIDAIAGGASINEALDNYGLAYCIVDEESKVDKLGEASPHMWGYAIVKDGVLVKAVNRTNPNKKWDWYRVGGRWAGFFKLKDGATGERGSDGLGGSCSTMDVGHADSLKKGSIDIEFMRDNAAQGAATRYDKLRPEGSEAWPSRDEVREAHPGNIDADRTAYHEHPTLVAVKARAAAAGMDTFFLDLGTYLVDRNTYVTRARNSALAPFAIVKDGQWFERGSMGWWGAVANEMGADDWNAKVNTLIDSLPDDTQLTLVDCHI